MPGQSLGPASEAEWAQFWDDLEQFLHVVHTRSVDSSGTFILNDVGMISDAGSLTKALKESTYVHRALNNRAFTQQVADPGFNSEFTNA